MVYGFEFDYGMPDLPQGVMMGLGGAVTAILLILVLLALAFAIVSYVLSAVGMYRIAKRRGIHHAWLAWVPVGNNWLLGSISDHYQYVVKHKATKRRKVLLTLNIILSAISLLFSGSVLIGNLAAIGSGAATNGSGAVAGIILLVLYYWLLLGLSIAAAVIAYIAYYDLFQSSKPNYAVLFLVLSVVFNATLPFFVFACSGSDRGMPARRTPKPRVQEVYEPEAQDEQIPVVEGELVDEPEDR